MAKNTKKKAKKKTKKQQKKRPFESLQEKIRKRKEMLDTL
jgi:hypothetical protein